MFDFLHKKAQDATPPALPEGTVRRRSVPSGSAGGVRSFLERKSNTAVSLYSS